MSHFVPYYIYVYTHTYIYLLKAKVLNSIQSGSTALPWLHLANIETSSYHSYELLSFRQIILLVLFEYSCKHALTSGLCACCSLYLECWPLKHSQNYSLPLIKVLCKSHFIWEDYFVSSREKQQLSVTTYYLLCFPYPTAPTTSLQHGIYWYEPAGFFWGLFLITKYKFLKNLDI